MIPAGSWFGGYRRCLFCGQVLVVEICHAKEPPDRAPEVEESCGLPHTAARCEEAVRLGGRGRHWEAMA
ncbi:MAG: hypothetical protein GC160_02835 [Acidobacteria bacterium]|nr:hypothetical protein [Acidobacteriota bacterium]